MGRSVDNLVAVALFGVCIPGITALSGCSDAKFTGLVSTGSQEDATVAVEPNCRFLRVPHPDLDSMLFDIWVSGSDVALKLPGYEGARPVVQGTGFAFLGIPLPIGEDGKVSASVRSGRKVGECVTTVNAVKFDVGPLVPVSSQDRSGVMAFVWKISGLYDGESLHFRRDLSVLSPDLAVDCESGGTEFNCRVSFKKREDSLSMRYKDQRFTWSVRADGIPERNILRPIDLDLLQQSAISQPADPALNQVAGPVIDPETCKPVSGVAGPVTGYRITHLCAGKQSLFGGLATGLSACKVIPADVCSPPP